MRILWEIFETKMYIWYTAPSAKIIYLGFNMSKLACKQKWPLQWGYTFTVMHLFSVQDEFTVMISRSGTVLYNT